MEAELRSQPSLWERAAGLTEHHGELTRPGERVIAIGCGTSWFVGQCYAALRERAAVGATDAYAASALPSLDLRTYDAALLISRSGTTTEILEVAESLRGVMPTIAIVADPQSPLTRIADTTLSLPFADEHSVVQTRFATTTIALMRAALGDDLRQAVADATAVIDEVAPHELLDAEQYTFLGDGWTVGLAHEAALKMRETAQAWTESYPANEYRHGPIAIAAPGRVTWTLGTPPPGIDADTSSTGARFENSGNDPLAELVRIQLVALSRARRQGLNPDQPRNLTRSVILA